MTTSARRSAKGGSPANSAAPRRDAWPKCWPRPTSEVILQSKLDLAQLAGSTNPAKAGGGGLIVATPTRAWAVPRRMVRGVEHFHPELESVSLCDPEILHGRKIDVPSRRTDQIVPSTVAELPGGCVGECGTDEVEIRIGVLSNWIDTGDTIQPIGMRDESYSGGVPRTGRYRAAALCDHSCRHSPATHHVAQQAAVRQKPLALSDRQGVKH